MAGLKQQLAAAVVLHQQGQWQLAQEAYLQLLQIDSQQPEVWHFLGVLLAQMGQPTLAMDYLGQCLASQPQHFVAHNNLAKLLQSQQLYPAALTHFQRAVELKPDFADARYNLASLLLILAQPAAALPQIELALALNPRWVIAYNQHGNILRQLGQTHAAVQSYQRAIELQPDYAAAHYNQGLVWWQLGSVERALACFEQAIQHQPDYLHAHLSRADLLLELQRYPLAISNYDRAIALTPDNAMIWFNRANALQASGHYPEALQSYQQALAIQTDFAEAYANQANSLRELGQLDLALQSIEQALQLQPDMLMAHHNRGMILRALGQYQSALQSYQRVIELQPDYALVYLNYGNLLQDLALYPAALQSYQRACELYQAQAAPELDRVAAHFSLSLALLLLGRFDLGWPEYEWRIQHPEFGIRLANQRPRWTGVEPVRGKTLLLQSEQGLGDTLQFCRYAAVLADMGARVILEVPSPLLLLLARVEGVYQTVLRGSNLPEFDYYCPLLSLPLALRWRLTGIPAPYRYIRSTTDKLAFWRSKLGVNNRPRIGLAWSGQAKHHNDVFRSMALAQFAALLPVGCQYVCLQNELRDADRSTLASRADLEYWGDELQDFTDTAALCDLMDVIVSVDTSLAHLAGAMGKPVLIVLPFNPDWRWQLDRTDSPWYPTARLYRRQLKVNDAELLQQIKLDLEQLLEPLRYR